MSSRSGGVAATGVRIAGRRLGRPGRRLQVALVAALLIVAILAGTAALLIRQQLDLGPPAVGVTEVAVKDGAFGPGAIEVPVGTTVSWRWEGNEAHNIAGDGFAGPTQMSGTFSHRFTRPGTYAYRCTLHSFMRGEVVVGA